MVSKKTPIIFLAGLFLGLGIFVLVQGSSGNAEEANSAAFFPDIEQGSYYDLPVLSMVRKGIVKGYDDGRFDPQGFVTRGQVVTMLHRYDREVIQPLRQQIAKLRELLKLGRCGDAKIQVGEECDDGNVRDGDGCSAECLLEAEPRPLPPLEPPTNLPEDPGCSVGGCSGQLCLEEGINVFTTCEWKEEYACYKEAKCERQTNRKCGWTETQELAECLRGGTAAECEEKQQELSDFIRSRRACRTDDDCAVLVRGCSPYLTCGKPVNKASQGPVKLAIAEYIQACPEEGPHICAMCVQRSAVCERGFCRLDPPGGCTEDVRECSDGSTVSRNPDNNCDFDPCSEQVPECQPYECEDGSTHPRCSEDGQVINYLIDPCQGSN